MTDAKAWRRSVMSDEEIYSYDSESHIRAIRCGCCKCSGDGS